MIWMALRPAGSEVQQVSAVEPHTPSAIELDPLPALAHDAPQPEPGPPPVAADDEDAKLSAMKAKLLCSTEWKGTQPHVAQVSHMVQKMFGLSDIGGAHGRYDGDHGAGLALDIMTSNPAQGDAIAAFVLANKARFGVTYVIWQQQFNDGSGWSYMEDRGSATQNHYDHVHVSFASYGAANLTC
ncbi:hypothetical protein [Nocardia neocaledoniensis]|uniref:hypothetical protein n=1 Tax=Nocardia neocaledoniensis TaxID=236511 RepID=UPI0024554E19|nr:hypothetical protein [Nocardia neocaledoniensis]